MSDRPRRRVNLPVHAPQQFRADRLFLAGTLPAWLLLAILTAAPAAAAGHAPRRPHHARAAAAAHAPHRPQAGQQPTHEAAHASLHPDVTRPPTDARLAVFYRALEDVDGFRRSRPVVVLQIGDSHTADDSFSGRLRQLFQRRFGAAGRGMLPAGIPYAYFRPAGVQVTATGWERFGGTPLGLAGDSPPPAMIGLAATRMHAAGAAEMTYQVDQPADLQRVAIEVLQQPAGGTLLIGYDDRPTWLLSTAAEAADGGVAVQAAQAIWVDLPATPGAGVMTLRTGGDGPVDLLAVDFRHAAPPAFGGGFFARPGLIWANLGTVGAQVGHVAGWDADVVATDLQHLQPDLVVLAFGTNEGFAASLDPAAYEAAYAEAGRRLTQTGASLAVIEPPDGDRLVPPGPRLPGAVAIVGPTMPAPPDSPAEPSDRCGPALDAAGKPIGTWETPPGLAVVRRVQAAAAARFGWFSWNWAAAMGGPCSMARWAAATPALAYPDHVHLREAGARQTAEALFSTLMSGYARFRAAAHGP